MKFSYHTLATISFDVHTVIMAACIVHIDRLQSRAASLCQHIVLMVMVEVDRVIRQEV